MNRVMATSCRCLVIRRRLPRFCVNPLGFSKHGRGQSTAAPSHASDLPPPLSHFHFGSTEESAKANFRQIVEGRGSSGGDQIPYDHRLHRSATILRCQLSPDYGEGNCFGAPMILEGMAARGARGVWLKAGGEAFRLPPAEATAGCAGCIS